MINTSFLSSIRKATLENSDEISHSRRRRALSGLRQPALRLCPDPVSALPGRASADVFLQDSRVLSLLPRQAAGGVGRVDAGDAQIPYDAYDPKVYWVPAVIRVNSLGISLPKAKMASNPVQWVGTMWSGLVALISATVFWMTSGFALMR